MSTLSISIPDSIRQRLEALAREDGVEVDSFVATVLSQRVAVADADSYVRRRARRGSAQQMREILALAPRVEPEPNDRLIPTVQIAPAEGKRGQRAEPEPDDRLPTPTNG